MLVLVSGTHHAYCRPVVALLQSEAHRVVIAADALAATQFLARASPHAVLVCASLPEELSADFVRAVAVHHIPAALITDMAEGEASRFLDAGFRCIDSMDRSGELLTWLRKLAS